MSSEVPLLSIEDLRVQFRTDAGVVRAVDGVSYRISPGETVAVVGESGCGKSVTALTILRLLESQRGEITGGQIRFHGEDLLKLPESEMLKVRGDRISMIFQEPMTSLNPVYTIGDQIGESLTLHRGLREPERSREVVRLLELVRIADAPERQHEYPHQLSGGMRQRVMIAMALACGPELLIADEPTTALDVTIQAQILALLADLQRRLGMSILLITHDLGVVAEVAERAIVMYAGKVVEHARVIDLFERPRHPYTVGLLRSLPDFAGAFSARLEPIPGNVPDALSFPSGCRFHPRCGFRLPECSEKIPELTPMNDRGQTAACFYSQKHPEHDLLTLGRGKAAK